MKKSKLFVFLMTFGLLISLTACGEMKDATKISLSEETITVDGEAISTDETAAVYVANDIISSDPVSSSVQTVVHITKPGTYALSGTLTTGQIAVDLGEDAVTDPSAVVTLVLDGVDIACDVAPAIVFYNAYECVPDTLEEGATIDAEAAGAKIFIRNKSENYLSGSYVIDEFESALYSAVTLNIDGKNKGELYVNAFTDYGDAIHSDGYLVLNGGTVNAAASAYSGNKGLDSEKGIFINGGNIVASSHLYDEIDGGEQNFAVFTFVESQTGGNVFEVKNKREKTILPAYCQNDFTILVVSGKKLKDTTYSFWCEDVQFMVAPGQAGGFMGDPSLLIPEGMNPEDFPDFMLTELNERPDPNKPDFGGRGDIPEFHVDEENADIVFDLSKDNNIFHVFY